MNKFTCCLFILFTCNSYGETYKCVNAQGNVTYKDAPCKNATQTNVVLKPINTMATANIENTLETTTPTTTLPLSNHYNLTVEEAYAAIPHKRTTFVPKQSLLAVSEINMLNQLFDFSDRAIVLKVIAVKAMQANDVPRVKQTIADYDALINHLSILTISGNIKQIQTNLLTAIQKHRHYFQTKQTQFETTNHYDQSFTSDIREASGILKQTYGLLMQAFPQESSNNKTAFYDYLCALDFL
jgi:Domain of unknown function (DUF4124)